MAAPAFVAKLNEQLGYEFGAHQQYVAIAMYCWWAPNSLPSCSLSCLTNAGAAMSKIS